MMIRQSRTIRRNTATIVAVTLFLLVIFLFQDVSLGGIHKFIFEKSNDESLAFARQDSPVVVQKTKAEPVLLETIKQFGQSVLGESGSTCGSWSKPWGCDKSMVDHEHKLVNASLKTGRAGKTIYFENIEFMKSPNGTEIGTGVNTVKIVDTDPDPEHINKEKFAFCDAGSPTYDSLAMINISQPLLPKVLEGLDISMRPISKDDKLYAKIDQAWFANQSPEEYLTELCGKTGSLGDSNMRTLDLFAGFLQSNNYGMDANAINAMCNALSPGTSTEDFAKNWEADKGVDTTTMRLWVKNTQNHEAVPDTPAKVRKTMIQDGLSGIVGDKGANTIGALVFQTKSQQQLWVRLMGTSVTTQGLSNMQEAPTKTSIDLARNKDGIEMTASPSNSSTVLSTKSTAVAKEEEREHLESAIFGGVYYIPASEIAKPGNASMLSYVPEQLDASRYMCDFNDRTGYCPIIGAKSGCAGSSRAAVRIQLDDMILSAVNDTVGWAGTTTFLEDKVLSASTAKQQTPATDSEIPRTWTRAGASIEGAFNSPNTSIKKASIDELVDMSGKGTTECSSYVKGRIASTTTTLTPLDRRNIQKELQSHNFITQSVLVTPVNVKYRTWAIYNRDPGVVALLRAIIPGIFGDEPLWGVDKINGEVIRPLLISFKMDSFFRGMPGFAPGATDSVDIAEQIRGFLSSDKLLIKPMPDWKIACRDASTGLPEYWLCSESGTILPNCNQKQ